MENLGEVGDNLAKEFGRLKNIANIGDIILVAGYFGREFRVDSYTHEIDYQPDYTEENILYDVSDIITGEYMLAYQEDISVIRRAESVEPIDTDFGWEWIGELKYIREEETSMKPKELTKEERIDRLLLEISDYKDLIRNFGDEDGRYQSRIASTKERLKEMTGGDRNGKG